MAKNPLYNFLNRKFEFNQCSDWSEKIQLKEDRERHNYFLIQLPFVDKSFQTLTETLTLVDHHLSVYETTNGSIPELSPYHYTAHFSDLTGLVYTLHVYYNDEDLLTTTPSFKRNEDSKVVFLELNSEFSALASEESKTFISMIRGELKETTEKLEAVLGNKDDEASVLSTDSAQRELYLEKLSALEAALVCLDPLVKHNNYAKSLSMIRGMKRSIEEELLEKTQKISPQGTNAVETEISNEEEEAPKLPQATSKRKRAKRNTKNHFNSGHFNKEVSDLCLQFQVLRRGINLSQIDLTEIAKINQLQEQANRLFLKINDKDKIKVEVLNNLRITDIKIRVLGESMLAKLLLTNRFNEAAELSLFHLGFQKEKFVAKAIKENNSELLSFLVKYCGLELQQPSIVKVKKEQPQLSRKISELGQSLAEALTDNFKTLITDLSESDCAEVQRETIAFETAFKQSFELGLKMGLNQLPNQNRGRGNQRQVTQAMNKLSREMGGSFFAAAPNNKKPQPNTNASEDCLLM